MTSRQRKGLQVYLSRTIVPLGNGVYAVQGRLRKDGSRNESYLIQPDPESGALSCNCKGFADSGACKHLGALAKFLKKGPPSQPYANVDESKRPTYPQDPVKYPVARRVALRALPVVIRDIARSEFPLPRNVRRTQRGRRPILMSDVLTCIALRSIYRRGGDLVQAVVDEAWESKLLHRSPRFNAAPPAASTITRRMRSPETHDAILQVIRAMDQFFKSSATEVLIDGTEFEIPNEVVGKSETALLRKGTIKAIVAVSRADNMVLDVHVVSGKSHEEPYTISMLEELRKRRFVTGLIGDKAYLSNDVLNYCEEHAIKVSVPPKINTSRKGDGALAVYARAWDERTPEEQEVYGGRQLVESANSRIKRAANQCLRGMTFAAQTSEVLGIIMLASTAWVIGLYVNSKMELPWLSPRARKILDRARELIKDVEDADRTPFYRDGLPQHITEDGEAA
jgi:hypothetical protein